MFLIVGISSRAVVESAVQAGFNVLAIDYYGDWDSRQQGPVLGLTTDLGLKPSVKNLLAIARSITLVPGGPAVGTSSNPFEGMVYTSGPDNHPEGLGFWERRGLLAGNPPSALKSVRDPWLLRKALAQISVAMPPFTRADRRLMPDTGRQWLLKPLASGGGHGIRLLSRDPVKARSQLTALEDKEGFIIQQFIPGIPCSATFLADGRRAVLLGTSRQLVGAGEPGARPFVYAGNIVPLVLPFRPGMQALTGLLNRIAGHLTATFGLKGLNTIDFIANSRGIWILEVNPRWSASVELIEKKLRQPLFAWHLAACGFGNAIDPELIFSGGGGGNDRGGPACRPPVQYDFWGKAIVYAQKTFTVAPPIGPGLLYRQGMRDIPLPGTLVSAGQPVCTVLVEAASENSCRQQLGSRAAWARRILGEGDGDWQTSVAY